VAEDLGIVALGPYTQEGNTANFNVYYDKSLNNGKALADDVLARCEQDFAELRALFGVTPGGLPFNVYIDPGTFGAYHAGCAATELHLAAFGGTDGALENMLNVAEADEVMMAAQNAGWDCGASAGEGLSRVLATEAYPAELDGFASAASWLDGTRPDWVTNTEPTDRDYVSIGCATLFLNYLRYQRRFPWIRIVRAGGATLAQTYQALTGRTDAFPPFAALLQSRFPSGRPSGVTNDNPFPIGRLLWHTLRHPDGSWTGLGYVEGEFAIPGPVAAVAGTGGASGETQWLFTTADGHLWHTLRRQDGSWTGLGDVNGQFAIPGPVAAVSAAGDGVSGETQFMFTTTDGHLWHTMRRANGTWTGLGDVNGQFAIPGPVAAVSAAGDGVSGETQFMFTTGDGHLWHTLRRQNGSWTGLGDVEGVFAIPGPAAEVAAAMGTPGETQFMLTT
jgi:hypothetical protein